jgi:antitoxin component YwqK of YwqJK toxin-antitoxin module
MKTKVFILLLWALTQELSPLYAQSEIKLQDIECYNLGDGRYFCRYKESEKPVQGTARIIDGYTTQYIDAVFKDGIPNGSWKTYRDNKLAEEYNYNAGILEGAGKEYYADGSVKALRNYAGGKLHGKCIDYDARGNVTREINFSNGEQHGLEIVYESDGTVRSQTNYSNGKATGGQVRNFKDYVLTANYDDQGQLDGEYSEIFHNGNVKSKGKYLHGKKEGLWETGRKDGKKMATEEFKAGDKVKETSYYTDNTVEIVRELRNGKKNGWERKYSYGDGKLTSELFYKDGELSSAGEPEAGTTAAGQTGLVRQTKQITSSFGSYTQLFYQSNGKYEGEYIEQYLDGNTVKTKGQYLNGKKEGLWVYTTPEGEKEREEHYAADILNGPVVKYSDGIIRESVEYRDDAKNGEFKEYDADGKLMRKGTYEDGKLHGMIEEYYPGGQLKSKTGYNKASWDGLRQKFYPNGRMELEETWVNGRKIGPYKAWTETGQLTEEGESARTGVVFQKTYQNGKLYRHEYRDEAGVRKVDFYDANGKKK